MAGRVTRLGDVTELLAKTDDRWVAFKGGDAIRIAYDASKLPPLAPGWRRDWILVSDGWDKDFDKNTVTGQSYEPWPFHAMSAYPYPPIRAPSRSEVPRGDAHAKGRAGAVPERAGGKIVLLAREPGRLRRPTVGLG